METWRRENVELDEGNDGRMKEGERNMKKLRKREAIAVENIL